jgi:hypothetical protein
MRDNRPSISLHPQPLRRHNGPMKTVAVYSPKGGVGKTTLAWHLTTRAKSQGIATVAVSLDRQGELIRLLTRVDRQLTATPFTETHENLTIMFSPDAVPTLPDAALAVYDCPPGPELVAQAKPDLCLVPTDGGPLQLGLLGSVLPELAASCGSVQLVAWSVRGGRKVSSVLAALRDTLARLPNVGVWDQAVQESPSIARTGDSYKPVWDSPLDGKSPAAEELARLCDGLIVHLGLARVH